MVLFEKKFNLSNICRPYVILPNMSLNFGIETRFNLPKSDRTFSNIYKTSFFFTK